MHAGECVLPLVRVRVRLRLRLRVRVVLEGRTIFTMATPTQATHLRERSEEAGLVEEGGGGAVLRLAWLGLG